MVPETRRRLTIAKLAIALEEDKTIFYWCNNPRKTRRWILLPTALVRNWPYHFLDCLLKEGYRLARKRSEPSPTIPPRRTRMPHKPRSSRP